MGEIGGFRGILIGEIPSVLKLEEHLYRIIMWRESIFVKGKLVKRVRGLSKIFE